MKHELVTFATGDSGKAIMSRTYYNDRVGSYRELISRKTGGAKISHSII